MKKIDPETGSKERTFDMKMILNLATVNTFNKMNGIDFIGRLGNFVEYTGTAHQNEMFLYNRVLLTGPATEVLAQDDNASIHYGVNYASADYLGLAQHPEAKRRASEALRKYSVCSGGTPSGLGVHE